MKQKAFTPLFAENLRSKVGENIEKYNNPDYCWENEAKEADAIIELDFEEPDLSGMMDYADNSLAKNDFFAGKILFEKFDHLTSLQAAQVHLWQYLSHVTLYKYMCTRWKKDSGEQLTTNNVSEHWFYGQGRIRNWLEGLFWSFRCTAIKQDDGMYDYKYTEFLFSIQKLRDRGIGAATYVISNPAAVRGMIRFYMDELAKKEVDPTTSVFDKHFEYRTDKCIQLINQLGGVIDLGAYDEDDFYNFLNDNREYIKSIGDRKKEKQERDAQLEAAGVKTKKSKNKKRKKRRR